MIFFLDKTKLSKIEKDEDCVDEASGSLKMTFEVILKVKFGFPVFNPVVMTSDGKNLQSSKAF